MHRIPLHYFSERQTFNQHVGAHRSNRWQAGRKKAWKPLESNYFWITRWHYQVTVLHICQFSHIPCLPLSFLYLFRQSGPMCPNVHFYETLWTSASWADKAPPENRLATAHILCNRFILLCLSVPSWCVAQQCQQVDGILHSGPNSQISLKEMFFWGVWEGFPGPDGMPPILFRIVNLHWLELLVVEIIWFFFFLGIFQSESNIFSKSCCYFWLVVRILLKYSLNFCY